MEYGPGLLSQGMYFDGTLFSSVSCLPPELLQPLGFRTIYSNKYSLYYVGLVSLISLLIQLSPTPDMRLVKVLRTGKQPSG